MSMTSRGGGGRLWALRIMAMVGTAAMAQLMVGCLGGSDDPQRLLDPTIDITTDTADTGTPDEEDTTEGDGATTGGTPVGGACTSDDMCGNGTAVDVCLPEVKPLRGLVQPTGNPDADAIWESFGLEFDGGYCGIDGACGESGEACGIGGTCFKPLGMVTDEVLDALASLGDGLPFDIYDFADFSICLAPCESDIDCPRDGYTCDVPLNDVLNLVQGASLETFCIAIGRQANYCDPDPCINGDCVNGRQNFTCDCFPGFEGALCEGETDACDPFPGTGITPCQNDGVCTDLPVGYDCECPDMYGGNDCEIFIEDCDPNPCINGGTCDMPEGTYVCTCPEGFSGNICQKEAP